MSVYTVQLNKQEINNLEEKLINANAEKRKTPAYAIFQYKTSECNITAYESGKVVFQGKDISFYTSTIKTESKNCPFEQGSDEVGTGDYFGPVVVCACEVKESDLAFISELSVMDSKQIKDEQIVKIAPLLMERLTYSLLILENYKYNEVHKTNNMNKIKAKLHNQAFLHLERKLNKKLENIIVDQFTPEKNYYEYLKEEKEVVRNIHFETKAENKYKSVACASIIARYNFLLAMKQMCEYYNFPFPKGAGEGVDEAGNKFVELHGIDKLNLVAKLHFKNTERIKKQGKA